jgi:hypothetical protein
MDMAVPIYFLLALAAIGVLLVGGLVLSVVLILRESTRVAGVVLLVLVLLGAPVAVGGLAVGAFLTPMEAPGRPTPAVRQRAVRSVPGPAFRFDPAVVPQPEPSAIETVERSPAGKPAVKESPAPPDEAKQPLDAGGDQSAPRTPDSKPAADAQGSHLLPGGGGQSPNT